MSGTWMLKDVVERLEQIWPILRAVSYELHSDEGTVTEDMWMTLVTRDARTLQFEVGAVGRPFTDWRGNHGLLSRLLPKYLGVDAYIVPDDIEKFPQLQFDDRDVSLRLPLGVQELNYTEFIDKIKTELAMKASALGDFNSVVNISQRDIISPVLAGAVLLARAIGEGGDVERPMLKSEEPIVGAHAWGTVDYTITYRNVHIIVVEDRTGGVSVPWEQVVMVIAAARDAMLRKLEGHAIGFKKHCHSEANDLQELPSYAIICSATVWRLLKYTPPQQTDAGSRQASIVQSGVLGLSVDFDCETEELRSGLDGLLRRIAHMVLAHSHQVQRAMERMPRLQQLKRPEYLAEFKELQDGMVDASHSVVLAGRRGQLVPGTL
eukprot:GHUV01030267.1.p1 GENE.GHUV01030267.1~~GHUV01030267.1.p1  ORF type:complete len:378 (+),score=76.25 GHUV01030267.1:239-1372(+)